MGIFVRVLYSPILCGLLFLGIVTAGRNACRASAFFEARLNPRRSARQKIWRFRCATLTSLFFGTCLCPRRSARQKIWMFRGATLNLVSVLFYGFVRSEAHLSPRRSACQDHLERLRRHACSSPCHFVFVCFMANLSSRRSTRQVNLEVPRRHSYSPSFSSGLCVFRGSSEPKAFRPPAKSGRSGRHPYLLA